MTILRDDLPRNGLNGKYFHFRILGKQFGCYWWMKNKRRGIVFRCGSLGHIQVMIFKNRMVGGTKGTKRRSRHGIAVHWWGVRGRTGKRGMEITVIR